MDTLISLSWVQGFLVCSASQNMFGRFISKRNARSITCALFQTYFLYNAWYIFLYNSKNSRELLVENINNMYGYFIYDTVCIFTEYFDGGYLVHHIISIIIIDSFKKTDALDVFYPNIICIFLESPSPLLNIRPMLRNYPEITHINNTIIYWSYFFLRIIAFPIISISYLSNNDSDYTKIFGSCLIIIYTASLYWFVKIAKL